ncbi:MAG: CZB domain-containing protein, partial [Bacillota bacterium]
MFKKVKSSMFAKFILAFALILILIIGSKIIDNYYANQVTEINNEINEMQELEIFLLNLEIDHHLWTMEIYDMMTGGKAPELEDHTECNLGNWYYDIEPEDFYREPFEAMEDPHTQLHTAGIEVVEAYENGQEEK